MGVKVSKPNKHKTINKEKQVPYKTNLEKPEHIEGYTSNQKGEYNIKLKIDFKQKNDIINGTCKKQTNQHKNKQIQDCLQNLKSHQQQKQQQLVQNIQDSQFPTSYYNKNGSCLSLNSQKTLMEDFIFKLKTDWDKDVGSPHKPYSTPKSQKRIISVEEEIEKLRRKKKEEEKDEIQQQEEQEEIEKKKKGPQKISQIDNNRNKDGIFIKDGVILHVDANKKNVSQLQFSEENNLQFIQNLVDNKIGVGEYILGDQQQILNDLNQKHPQSDEGEIQEKMRKKGLQAFRNNNIIITVAEEWQDQF